MAVKGFQLVKTLIKAYVITAVLLLLTAFGLYRLHLSDWQVMAAVVIIYALSCFAGGYILAKAQKSRRMLWGMGFGILYFTVLTAAAFILTKGADMDMTALVKALIVCLLAGGAGAFATPE